MPRPKANSEPRDLGQFHYIRSYPVACRLVLVKKKARGRHRKTVHGKVTRSGHSLKQAKAQALTALAVTPQLATLSPRQVVTIDSGRMSIEQSFRDVKHLG